MNGLKEKKILIVEDDPDLRDILREDLEAAGLDVTAAESGQAAMKLLKENSFDIVISDMRMPKGDGQYLLREINAQLTKKPMFFLYSGFNEIPELNAEKMGVLEIFHKPFRTADLLKSILAHVTTQ